MDWFGGSIGEAIALAKSEQGVFLVAIHASTDGVGASEAKESASADAASAGESAPGTGVDPFLALLDEQLAPLLRDKLPTCTALKLTANSVAAAQFSALYPVVLVPSLYWIDSRSGVDIEVTGGGNVNRDTLVACVGKVTQAMMGPPTARPSVLPVAGLAQVSNEGAVASPRRERVDQAQQLLQQNVPRTDPEVACSDDDDGSEERKAASSSDQARPEATNLEERVNKAKRLLAEKQAKKHQEEKENDRNGELGRRELGRQMQELRRQQEEDALREAAEERRRDREETKLARERVKMQIEQDRQERANKFNKQRGEEQQQREEKERQKAAEQARLVEEANQQRHTLARIQFRLPDGRSKTKVFEADDPLSALFSHVREEMDLPFRTFTLSTTFPTKVLDHEEQSSTLRSHKLTPSATILVLPKADRPGGLSQGGDGTGFFPFLWFVMAPLQALWRIVQSILGLNQPAPAISNQESRNEADSTRARPGSGGAGRGFSESSVSRDGNVARLRNADDDDENNTWNGNSTQQQQ